MKKRLVSFSLAIALSVAWIPYAYAGEIWSDGDFQLGPPVQQPSVPAPKPAPAPAPSPGAPSTNNGLWSENLWLEPPPQPAPTQPAPTIPAPTTPAPALPTPPPTTSPTVPVQPAPLPGGGQPAVKPPTLITFDVPIVMENSRALVPARDILAPLGAELQYDSIKQLVTVRKGSTTVHVINGNNMAMVNGNFVKLDAPVKLINGRTFIPISFLTNALGYKVDYDTATTKVTVDGWLSFYLDPKKAPKTNQPPANTQTNFFVGNWSIWIPGGYATTGTSINGDGSKTVTQQYVPGAKGYTLSILSNGTYSWQTTGGTITGTWRTEPDGRIVLLKGKYEYDWYVSKTGENEIKFYSWGMEEYGTRVK